MDLQFKVMDEMTGNLSSGAKATLENEIAKYAESVLREAKLIEEGNHEDGAKPEITSTIILRAVRKNRDILPKRRSGGLIILKIVSTLSLLVAGFLFDPSGYQDAKWKLILFIIVLMVATGTTVAQFVVEERG